MWTTSTAFDEALTSGTIRELRQRVEVMQGGEIVHVLDTVVSGTVTIEDAKIRRTCELEITDPDGTLTPASAKDLLAPKGTELRIWKGLHLGPGNDEYVPLGTFRISRPTVTHGRGALTIAVKGKDRGSALQRFRFLDPFLIDDDTPTAEAIESILASQAPQYPRNISESMFTTPALVYDRLSDPLDAIWDLANGDGCEPFFDPMGTFVCRPILETDQPTVWDYAYGDASLLLEDERELDEEQTYSGVSFRAEHPDRDPIRVDVWDDDPESPTYYLGDFGAVPYGFFVPSITTEAQAEMAAMAQLQRVRGLLEKVALGTIGHWGHEIGDSLHLYSPRSRMDGIYRIDRIQVPIRRGPMSLRLRAQRLV